MKLDTLDMPGKPIPAVKHPKYQYFNNEEALHLRGHIDHGRTDKTKSTYTTLTFKDGLNLKMYNLSLEWRKILLADRENPANVTYSIRRFEMPGPIWDSFISAQKHEILEASGYG